VRSPGIHRESQQKCILLIEENDRLFAALKDALLDAHYKVLEGLKISEDLHVLPSNADAAVFHVTPRTLRLLSAAKSLARRGVPIVYIAHVPVNLSFSQGDSVTLTMPFTEQHLLDALESLLDHESSNRIPTHESAHEREESPSV